MDTVAKLSRKVPIELSYKTSTFSFECGEYELILNKFNMQLARAVVSRNTSNIRRLNIKTTLDKKFLFIFARVVKICRQNIEIVKIETDEKSNSLGSDIAPILTALWKCKNIETLTLPMISQTQNDPKFYMKPDNYFIIGQMIKSNKFLRLVENDKPTYVKLPLHILKCYLGEIEKSILKRSYYTNSLLNYSTSMNDYKGCFKLIKTIGY